MGATALLAVGTAVGTGSSLISSQNQSKALEAQGEYAKWQGETNARFAEIQAADAIRRGDMKAKEVKLQTRKTIGAQRANLASQGVQVSSGSALKTQEDTAATGALDVKTVENNAWREAWGFKVDAANSRAAGDFGQEAAKNASRNTLLTGGVEALKQGLQGAYLYKKGG